MGYVPHPMISYGALQPAPKALCDYCRSQADSKQTNCVNCGAPVQNVTKVLLQPAGSSRKLKS